MMKIIASLICLLFFLAPAKAQGLLVPMGTELMYSREHAGLIGHVRAVLTVEKRDEGGFVRTFSTTTDTFNPKGAAIEKLSHHADIEIHSGKLVRLDYTDIYAYDSAGKLFQVVTYDPDGSYRQKIRFIYDAKGRLFEEIAYGQGDTMFSKSIYTYDVEKRSTTMMLTTYYEGRVIPPSKSVFTYNAKGQWIKRMVYDSKGAITDNTAFDYDEKGNLVKETRYDEKGAYSYAHTFSYKFDSHGNWIERQMTYTQLGENGKAISQSDMVTYRVITYYEEK
jgi:hypothetical protein